MQIVAPTCSRTDVLRALCVGGPGTAAQVARRTGIANSVVHGELVAAESLGLTVHCPATDRWSSSIAGRILMARLSSEEASYEVAAGLRALGRRLDELDGEVSRIQARWYLRDPEDATVEINDHTDPAYDAAVLEEVGRTHGERLEAVYAAVVVVPRLERYAGRLADAWRRVRLGELAALGDPERDPYFSVWVEFLRDVRSLVTRPRPGLRAAADPTAELPAGA